ncbi:MAG: hypothetical protein KDA84_26635, partial [Planctomycetaceae bacterium]|nr:hypothetical protein [Planctomycetaceae bacterium]
GGGVSRNGNQTQLQGEYRRPSTFIPGAQERYQSQLTINGRNSSLAGGMELYDGTGRYRFSGSNMHLNGRRYTQSQDVGLGGSTARQTQQLKFQGMNSRFSNQGRANVGGIAGANQNFQLSRSGASGSAKLKVGGASIGASGSVNSNGVRLRVTSPKVSLPRINPPKTNAPKISFGKFGF